MNYKEGSKMINYELYMSELNEIEKHSCLEESMYSVISELLYTIPTFRKNYVAINIDNARGRGKNEHYFFKNDSDLPQCAARYCFSK